MASVEINVQQRRQDLSRATACGCIHCAYLPVIGLFSYILKCTCRCIQVEVEANKQVKHELCPPINVEAAAISGMQRLALFNKGTHIVF